MGKYLVSIIVAMDEKRGIGKGNDLLFRIPEDQKRVRGLTSGHPIIMGRRTFESIGRVLPNRTNIVISRDRNFHFEGIIVCHSLEDALAIAKEKPGSEEVFIFGGGQLFKEALEKGVVDKLYLTIVKGDYGADTFFPEYSEFTKVIDKKEGKYEDFQYTFLDLQK